MVSISKTGAATAQFEHRAKLPLAEWHGADHDACGQHAGFQPTPGVSEYNPLHSDFEQRYRHPVLTIRP
jgi:hypothetical protein